MGNMFYNGTPVEQVNFDKELDKELAQLKQTIQELERKRKEKGQRFNAQFWMLKVARANKALENGMVTLSGGENREEEEK